MPLEISEIGVHIAVGGTGPDSAQAQPGKGKGGPAKAPVNPASGLSPEQHEAIVSECVQRVLAHLRQQEER